MVLFGPVHAHPAWCGWSVPQAAWSRRISIAFRDGLAGGGAGGAGDRFLSSSRNHHGAQLRAEDYEHDCRTACRERRHRGVALAFPRGRRKVGGRSAKDHARCAGNQSGFGNAYYGLLPAVAAAHHAVGFSARQFFTRGHWPYGGHFLLLLPQPAVVFGGSLADVLPVRPPSDARFSAHFSALLWDNRGVGPPLCCG